MRKKLLIVEDDEALASVLADNFAFCGFAVERVGTARPPSIACARAGRIWCCSM
jgi:DNA-binding response OmpR family regulator